MHVVVRADGDSEIGHGHLIRSSALVETVVDRGQRATVATTTPETARTIFPEAAEIVEFPSRADPDPFVEWLDTAAPDMVFTDAYPVDTAYQQAVQQRVPLAVLQDDARHTICADLFVNGNLYASDLEYEFVGDPPEMCLGPDYVLLRREIREHVDKEPPWREQPQRAIVMMGGSDIAGLTPTVVRAFDGIDLHVDAIVGPGCSTELERNVRRAAAEISAAVSVSRDPNNLVDLMMGADVAVSTASTTTYELLALGTPIVSIPVVANQDLIAGALRNRDAATVLQRDTDKEAFRDAITKSVNDADLRQKRRSRGRELVDGNGADRVVAKILGTDQSQS